MSGQPTKRPRVRQACAACRDSKLRCDLGDPGVPKDPPCQRCARTGRSCNFVGSHLQSKPRKMRNRKSVAASSTVEASTSPSAVPRQAESSAASTSPTRLIDMSRAEMPAPAPRVTSPYSSSLGGIGHLETPADALRILCAAANDELAVQAPPPRSSSPHDSKIWSRWEPVRDGLLTADEAAMLLSLWVAIRVVLISALPTMSVPCILSCRASFSYRSISLSFSMSRCCWLRSVWQLLGSTI